jgi:hypothetical protein
MAPLGLGFAESYPNNTDSRATCCRVGSINRAVQVSDLTTNGGAAVPRTDESGGPAREGARERVRSNKPFRDAFKHARASESAVEAAGISGAPPWFRAEPIRVGPPAAKVAAAPPARIDRVLIGSAGGEAEARIRIAGGALAGAEIRLITMAGSQAVTAQLLTPTAGSRQTLFVAMEEIRLRLRDKGIALASSVTRGRAESEGGHEGHGEGNGDGQCDGRSSDRDGSGDGWRAER